MIVHIMPTYLFIYTYSHTHTLPRRLGTGKEINSSSRKFNKKSLFGKGKDLCSDGKGRGNERGWRERGVLVSGSF